MNRRIKEATYLFVESFMDNKLFVIFVAEENLKN